MTKTPLCVIGGGSIGFRHVSVATASDHVELTAVVEPFEPRRKELLAMGLPAVATLEDVPKHTQCTVIATPTPDHANSAHAALDQGWAAIVEKPVTDTIGAGRALCAAADRLDLPLFTGHHRRCHPFSVAAKDHLRKIGDIVSLQGLWSLRKHDSYYDVEWRRKAGAGPILTNLSHEIDLLRFFAGEIESVSAMTSNATRGLEVEDTASLSFRFADDVLGSFLISDAGASPWSFEAATGENPDLAYSGQDSIRIIGTKGALSFPSLTRWHGDGGQTVDWRATLIQAAGPKFEKIDPLLAQIERFAHVVDGGQDNLLATGRDGVKTLEITLATLLSAQQSKTIGLGQVPDDFNGGAL
jgi:predicted dehydrogenase